MRSGCVSAICFLSAALCLVYFSVILGYGGIETAFCLVWLFFTAVFLSIGFFLRRSLRHRQELPDFLPTFIYTTFLLGAAGFVLLMNTVILGAREDRNVMPEYCIVMGARVYPDGISRTLLYRLEKACELYERDPEVIFVLSGGQDSQDAIPEAFAMYNYLSMQGIPSSAMLVEPRMTTTAGIIRSACDAIRADDRRRRMPKGPGEQVQEHREPVIGIITSDYHMFRSQTIARQSGIPDPRPIPSRSDSILFVHNCVRESAAIIKDFLMGNVIVDESHMPEVPIKRMQTN